MSYAMNKHLTTDGIEKIFSHLLTISYGFSIVLQQTVLFKEESKDIW